MKLIRDQSLAGTVVVVTGTSGSGKSMISFLTATLERVEMKKYDYPLEWACQMAFLGSLSDGDAAAEIRMLCDLDLYNLMMAREANFRVGDLSSVFKAPRPWRYVRRLFGPGDAAAAERIRTESPILNLETHNLFSIGRPLFTALGERLRMIQIVRHPLHTLRPWRGFMPRYATDPRHFSIWFEHEGRALPWFAKGWEEAYLSANMMDRAIRAIDRVQSLADGLHSSLSIEEKSRVMVIPFEDFVTSPEPHMERLQAFIGAKATTATARELKRQKVPRRLTTEGRVWAVHRSYGWKPPTGESEAAELKVLRDYAAVEATPEAMALLDRMSQSYEARYPCRPT